MWANYTIQYAAEIANATANTAIVGKISTNGATLGDGWSLSGNTVQPNL